MKAFYNRERKSYGLASSYFPQSGLWVSGVVSLVDEEGKGYCYVKFSDSLVEAVGMSMPYGVGPEHPCYLRVVHRKEREVWRVYAEYLSGDKKVLLWESIEKPVWVKRVRR